MKFYSEWKSLLLPHVQDMVLATITEREIVTCKH